MTIGTRDPQGFFVMLSGYSLQASFTAAKGRVLWPRYALLKAIGLFPIYYLSLLVYLPCYLALRNRPGPAHDEYKGWVPYLIDGIMYLTAEQAWNHGIMARGDMSGKKGVARGEGKPVSW